MKKLIILILLALLGYIFYINKTFFKDYYLVQNGENTSKIFVPRFSYFEDECCAFSVTFSSVKSENKLNEEINNYLSKLQTCYENNYYYDQDENITITSYRVEKKLPFNKIYLVYDKGNYCKDEFVLDKDWLYEFNRYANINGKKIYYYYLKDNLLVNENKDINNENLKKIIDLLNDSKTIRENYSEEINMEPSKGKYFLEIEYKINEDNNKLIISDLNNKIVIKIIQNNHAKYAVYKTDENINNILKNMMK